jgi:hypothetical protein
MLCTRKPQTTKPILHAVILANWQAVTMNHVETPTVFLANNLGLGMYKPAEADTILATPSA